MTDPQRSLESLFTEAWLNVDESSPLAEFHRMSLEASTAGNPALESILTDLKAPRQAELDLHLSGAGVSGHQTNAAQFGQFVSRVARAVKEIAKSTANRDRLPSSLQVVGPSAGSVRVIFRAPDVRHREETYALVGDSDGDSLDTLALKTLTSILSHADDEDEIDSPLTAEVQSLNTRARVALRVVGKSLVDADWAIEGELRQRGQGVTPLAVSSGAARRLVAATGRTQIERTLSRVAGAIDGQRRSLNAMWFVPDSGPNFEAAVPDPEMLRVVAALSADPDNRVRAEFDVFLTYGLGDSTHPSRSYSLRALEVVGEQLSLPEERLAIADTRLRETLARMTPERAAKLMPRALPPGTEDN